MSNPIGQDRDEAIKKVGGILATPEPRPAFSDLKKLAKKLKALHEFRLARKLLAHCQKSFPPRKEAVWVTQQLALCTYKDEELLPAQRFAAALELLESIGLRRADINPAEIPPETLPETLALGGAVYKRMFEYSGQLENLHNALVLYRAAWQHDPRLDMGYGGVNAAYVLDLLASRLATVAVRAGAKLDEVERLRNEARQLRQEMAGVVSEAEKTDATLLQQYWYAVTLAEIHFGLRDYDQAGYWLAKAKGLEADEWERQTTFRQLVSLARMQGHVPPDEKTKPSDWGAPWKALAGFLGDGARGAFSCWRGKVGLALSGGGFRASLFHLGVLARLAEMDVLRSVEALSTVSGGSIVGAHYYLELQALLQKKQDAQITRDDYVQIVQRVQERFLKGVQKNLRTRVLTNLGCTLRMLVPSFLGQPPYSRSHRIGELYEAELYSQVGDEPLAGGPRTMPGLRVNPASTPSAAHFRPKFSNWQRAAKVPTLLLNTTSLNSGHSWQFTSSWMGEPPGLVGEEVDANVRYRRLYYQEAPTEELKNYRLGYAVAASACVPALFDPLVIKGLYPGRVVRLVDGGVHDNQGAQGLLDESCTFILCSDASGQMGDDPSPSDGMIGVPLRANSILGSRVREAEYQDLRAREENRALQGLFFIHLKQGLSSGTLDWVDCQDPRSERPRLNTTDYNVDRDLQRKLTGIRTDLDSFTEVEAYALMLSGYLMTEHQFKVLNERHHKDGNAGTWGGFDVHAGRRDWPFLALEPIMCKPSDSPDLRRKDLEKQLEVAAGLAFKVWCLVPALRAAAFGLPVGVIGALIWLAYQYWDQKVGLGPWSLGAVVVALALFIAGLVFPLLKLLDPRKAMRSWLLQVALGILGWGAANIQVWLFDPIFLKRGKLERLLRLPAE